MTKTAAKRINTLQEAIFNLNIEINYLNKMWPSYTPEAVTKLNNLITCRNNYQIELAGLMAGKN